MNNEATKTIVTNKTNFTCSEKMYFVKMKPFIILADLNTFTNHIQLANNETKIILAYQFFVNM